VFQTQESTEHHWVIFYQYDKFSIFTFSDTISTHYEVRDLDDDRMLDLVEWHKVFEEGTGYETYITWYRWNGAAYVQHETTNVVRNLNAFLSNISARLEQGQWRTLLRETLEAEDRRRLAELDSTAEQFARLFRSEKEPLRIDELRNVIFPTIFENPFHSKDSPGSEGGGLDTVRFSARFVYKGGMSQVRECEVAMSRNPFRGREFFLVLR
jgi:hypothetical protein